MSVGRPMELRVAHELANRVLASLESHCKRISVAGSIRRQLPVCHDIEVVLEPFIAKDMFGVETGPIIEPLHDKLRSMGTWGKGATRYVQIHDVFEREGVKLDVFMVHPPAEWGSILAIRTGPQELGTWCVTKMWKYDFRHLDGHVVKAKTGEVVPTPSELDFFGCAGIECVSPRLRDRQARRLGAYKRR